MQYSVIPDDVRAAAERLSPTPICEIHEVRKGANSRVFRVVGTGESYALKKYPAERGRQGAEARALTFFERSRFSTTARLVAMDSANHISLLSWIDGDAPGPATDADIGQFIEFQVALDRAIDDQARTEISEASEACLSGARILGHIRSRLDRLAAVRGDNPGFADFYDTGLLPALERTAARACAIYEECGLDFEADLPVHSRTLIASDYGTHNALRDSGGRLRFVDFEYFGWDDPLTSIGNFILHPGMQLTSHQQDLYVRGIIDHFGADHERRLPALMPLFALRWCMIILGELLPERWRHRVAANADLGDWEDVKMRQIAKARDLIRQFVDRP